jgi:hypothetical protein
MLCVVIEPSVVPVSGSGVPAPELMLIARPLICTMYWAFSNASSTRTIQGGPVITAGTSSGASRVGKAPFTACTSAVMMSVATAVTPATAWNCCPAIVTE